MSFTFPNIKPNHIRVIDLPNYTNLRSQWKTGVDNIIRTQYQGIDTNLTLEYQHLDQDQVITISNFYALVFGTSYSFSLPNGFYKLPTDAKTAIAELGSTTLWKFINEPVINVLVSTTSRGRYNTQLNLRSVSA